MSPNAFTLRVATAEDAAALAQLAARTFADAFGHLFAPQDLADYLADAYNADRMRSEILDPTRHTVLVFSTADASTPCGYVMLHDGSVRSGDVDGDPADYLEIKRVFVDKPFHGKGAAQVLTQHAMEVVKEKNCKIVWLGVWENNFRAIRFYQKLGFVETARRQYAFGRHVNSDLVLTLTRDDAC